MSNVRSFKYLIYRKRNKKFWRNKEGMSDREGYFHDYLAASFVGVALGLLVTIIASAAIGNWGIFVAVVIVLGLFVFMPAGFMASYLNFRFHRMGENSGMAGLSAGLFTAIVYTVVTLIIAVLGAIANTPAAANTFIAWILSIVFAFIFMSLGGYVSGIFEERPFAMPGIFNLSKISRLPPPPPPTDAQFCSSCQKPMNFIQQYNRWYCDNCKKYS